QGCIEFVKLQDSRNRQPVDDDVRAESVNGYLCCGENGSMSGKWSTLTLSVGAVCLGLLLCVPLFVYWPEPYRPARPPAAIEALASTQEAPPDDSVWEDTTLSTRALLEYALDQGVAWLERSVAAAQTP